MRRQRVGVLPQVSLSKETEGYVMRPWARQAWFVAAPLALACGAEPTQATAPLAVTAVLAVAAPSPVSPVSASPPAASTSVPQSAPTPAARKVAVEFVEVAPIAHSRIFALKDTLVVTTSRAGKQHNTIGVEFSTVERDKIVPAKQMVLHSSQAGPDNYAMP